MNRTITTTALFCAAGLGVAAAPAADAKIERPKAHCTIAPKKSYSFDTLLKRGIRVPVTCDAPADVSVVMSFSEPASLEMHMPGNGHTDLTGQITFAGPGTRAVTVRMNARSRKRLRKSDTRGSGFMLAAVGDPGARYRLTTPKDGRTVTFKR